MRTLTTGSLIVGLICTSTLLVGSSAEAASKAKPCMSMKEFGALKNNMTIGQVAKRVGLKGKKVGSQWLAGDAYVEDRSYRPCQVTNGADTNIVVGFVRSSYPGDEAGSSLSYKNYQVDWLNHDGS